LSISVSDFRRRAYPLEYYIFSMQHRLYDHHPYSSINTSFHAQKRSINQRNQPLPFGLVCKHEPFIFNNIYYPGTPPVRNEWMKVHYSGTPPIRHEFYIVNILPHTPPYTPS